ncbi:MAG: hypothetical protein RIR25_1219 [Verrucomicrobiota bacterium]
MTSLLLARMKSAMRKKGDRSQGAVFSQMEKADEVCTPSSPRAETGEREPGGVASPLTGRESERSRRMSGVLATAESASRSAAKTGRLTRPN